MYKIDEYIKNLEIFKKLKKDAKENIIKNSYIIASEDVALLNRFCDLVAEEFLLKTGESCDEKTFNMIKETNIVKTEENKIILLDDIKNVLQLLQIPSRFREARKVCILDFVQKPKVEILNKLLKTLEEPENDVKFIIKTTNHYQVIDTIKSRSTLLEIKQLDKNNFKKFLLKANNDERKVDEAFSVCNTMTSIFSYISGQNNEAEKNRKIILDILKSLRLKNSKNIINNLNYEINSTNIKIFLETFLTYVRYSLDSIINKSKAEIDYSLKFYLKTQETILKYLRAEYFKQQPYFIIRNLVLELIENKLIK